MKRKSDTWKAMFAGAGMLILILDSRLVLSSAGEGINMCLNSIIPALFPFLVIGGIITGNASIHRKQCFSKISEFLGIPHGSEHLLLLGFLGGYPNGAQNIYQLYDAKNITKEDAERMLPICNQAGPAFIFGITPFLFASKWTPFALWIIQIFAALITSAMLPKSSQQSVNHGTGHNSTLVASCQAAVRTMGWICGWVVLFRIIIDFLKMRILCFLPVIPQVIIAGTFELTNGIFALSTVQNSFIRFLLTSVFLSFGGFCVLLQTKSVIKDLSLKIYFIGKVLQLLISLLLSAVIYPIIFEANTITPLQSTMIYLILFAIILIFRQTTKKTVAIQKNMLYNKRKSESEVLV